MCYIDVLTALIQVVVEVEWSGVEKVGIEAYAGILHVARLPARTTRKSVSE